MVQQFVRDRRETRTRTTAVEVMMYLKEMCVLDIDVDDKKQFAASYRTMQRFLKAQGYKRGRRKGYSTYHLSKAIVAGIPDCPTMASKVMALDIFTGGKSRAKEPKDYHGMFDHAYYVKWFGRLLDEMDASGVTKALIVLDNAKYHKCLPESTPTSGRRKSILLDACRLYGIQTTGKEFKSELWDMLASHIKAHIHPVIVEMAKHRGHCAIVKGEVGRQYTDMTKFADMKVRLEAAFANLKPNSIKGCVRAAQEKLKKLHEHLVQIDTLVSDEESSDDSDNSSDDGGDSEYDNKLW
ncbi:hypothetical protein DYB38_009831 [Aphanomyces astaci]|nr:hypothetical protein DYB38_009831 [Aphanomyces astaci]